MIFISTFAVGVGDVSPDVMTFAKGDHDLYFEIFILSTDLSFIVNRT